MTPPASVALAVKDAAEPAVRERGRASSQVGTDPIIAEARRRWAKGDEAEDAQRKSILAAKKFRSGDQWPEAIRLQREGASSIGGVAAQPARPCLTIDRLSQPIRQLSNQIKQSNFAIDVLPNGFGADAATADIYKGYLRRVQNQARAESPVEWAADGAIEGGIGWFRILTEYAHETWDGDPADPRAYEQELRLGRITNNLTVYCDPSAVKPTRSDAMWMIVTEDLDRDEFKSRWPKADVQGIDDFVANGDMKGWSDKDNIRIAEYWRVTYTDQKVSDGTQERVIRKPKVEGFKITASEVLEQWEWLGSRIPLIPILGEELNIDGQCVLRGITQEGMDAQRMVNYTYSGAMEIFALGNKSPWIAATGAVDAYKQIWQTANTANYSWLPWDAFDEMGRPMSPPQRDTSEPPIQAAVALMLKSEEAIKATTGVYDPSLEYNNKDEHSGKAIQSLQAQSDVAGSNYPMHVQRALIYAGELMVEIIPKITRPGQVLQLIGVDDKPEQVLAGQPFQPGADGQPIPQDQHVPDLTEFYDLTKGRYAVTVAVGKGSATRREEGAAALAALIPHLPPEMAAVATPDYVEQLSFPGAHKIAEKLKKVLPPHLQDDEDGTGGPDPEKQQLQQQVQQLQQALESKQAEEQAKQQAQTQREMGKAQMQQQGEDQRAQLDAQVKIQLEEMKNATAIRIAEINAAVKGYQTEAQHAAQHEQQALNLSGQQTAQVMDAQQAEAQRDHEMQMADRQAAFGSEQQAAQQAHDAEMAAQQGPVE